MSYPDNNPEKGVFRKSLPLINECLKEKISITLLLSTLQLMDRGLIKEEEDLESFLRNRKELAPQKSYDVERIKEMILKSYF